MIDIGSLEVRHPDGQVFTFEPGSLALAFAITGPGTRRGPLAHFQTLRVPSDVGHWAADIVEAHGIRASAGDLELALSLQAVVWNVANAIVDHRPVATADLDALNALAAKPSLVPSLVPRLVPSPARSWAPRQSVAALVSTVARDAIDVFGGPRAARLKRCEGLRCSLLFVDTSRPGHRRWCSMDRCGNRAKATAHRRRRKESES